MTDNGSLTYSDYEQPGRFAWLVFRSLARFWGSIFLSYFRIWGETEFKPGTIIVARNYGLPIWVFALRFFAKPVRIVLSDDSDDRHWFQVAKAGGLEPQAVSGSSKYRLDTLQELSDAGEIVFLILPRDFSSSVLDLLKELDENFGEKLRFFAVEGATKALPKDAIVTRCVPICVFCGRPFFNRFPGEGLADEFVFLESTLRNLDIDEEPSFFRNKRRDL